MNQADIIWRLAELASLPYHERYIINGTDREYVLAVELLENVEALKYRIDRPENADLLTARQQAAIHDLVFFITECAGDALSGQSRAEQAELIRHSDSWKGMRAKAGYALTLFDLPAEMSIEDINCLHASSGNHDGTLREQKP